MIEHVLIVSLMIVANGILGNNQLSPVTKVATFQTAEECEREANKLRTQKVLAPNWDNLDPAWDDVVMFYRMAQCVEVTVKTDTDVTSDGVPFTVRSN